MLRRPDQQFEQRRDDGGLEVGERLVEECDEALSADSDRPKSGETADDGMGEAGGAFGLTGLGVAFAAEHFAADTGRGVDLVAVAEDPVEFDVPGDDRPTAQGLAVFLGRLHELAARLVR